MQILEKVNNLNSFIGNPTSFSGNVSNVGNKIRWVKTTLLFNIELEVLTDGVRTVWGGSVFIFVCACVCVCIHIYGLNFFIQEERQVFLRTLFLTLGSGLKVSGCQRNGCIQFQIVQKQGNWKVCFPNLYTVKVASQGHASLSEEKTGKCTLMPTSDIPGSKAMSQGG